MPRILLIDNDAESAVAATKAIIEGTRGKAKIDHRLTLTDALGVLSDSAFECVLLDPAVADQPMEVSISACAQAAPSIPILVTARSDPGGGPKAIRAGAHDYILKDSRVYPALVRIVLYTIERHLLQEQQQRSSVASRGYEQLISDVFRLVTDPLIVADDGSIIRWCTAASASITGVGPAELIGHPLRNLFVGRSLVEFERSLGALRDDPQNAVSATLDFRCGDRQVSRGVVFSVVQTGSTNRWILLQPASGRPVARLARKAGDEAGAFFQIVSLAAVRERLSQDWSRVASKVGAIAERVLGTRLVEGERFQVNYNGDYAVMFLSGTLEQAVDRAAEIALTIENTVLGAQHMVRPQVVEPVAVLDGDVPPRLEAEVAATEDIGTAAARELKEAIGSLRVEPGKVLQSLYVAPPPMLVPILGQGLRPSELCLPVFDTLGLGHLSSVRETIAAEAEGSGDFDLLVMSKVASMIAQSPAGAKRQPIVEVGYETLVSRQSGNRFLDVLRSLPPPIRNAMLPCLAHVPAGTYPPKLARQAALLGEEARAPGLYLHRPRTEMVNLSDVRPRLVMMDYDEVETEIWTRSHWAIRLIERARQLRAKVLIRHVPEARLANVIEFVDYVSTA